MPELDNGAVDAPQPQENILVANFVQGFAPMPHLAAEEVNNAFEQVEQRMRELDDEPFEPFHDDEDDEFDDELEQELDQQEREEREAEAWEQQARVDILNGRVPDAPPAHMNINEIEVNGQRVQFHRNPVPAEVPAFPRAARIRRGNRVAAVDGRHIPAGFQEQVRRDPPRPMPGRGKPMPYKKQVAYVAEGVVYNGYRFSRELTFAEKNILKMVGYHDIIKMFPDLIWTPKEVVIDENEECIILLSELADFLAVQACKANVADFDIKEHTKEYQIVYKRFLQDISSFKRPKNG